MRTSPWLPLAFAALVAASGCAALPGLDSGADTPPTEDVAAAFGDLETVSTTQVSSTELNSTTSETRMEIRLAVDENRVRRFSRVLEPESQAGDVTVATGGESLMYDASENTVTRVEQTETAMTFADRGEYYASVVAAARNGSTISLPDRGVSPLPVVPAESTGTGVESDDIQGYAVEYLGTDEVADRRVHGFRMTAVADAAIDMNQTVWLDAEFYYPLRSEQTVTLDNQTYEFDTRMESVEFNADLPSDTFDWTPPANATEETISVDTERFDSLDALAEAAPLSVPEPDLPEDYAFDSGRLAGENVTQVTAEYGNGDGDTVTVSKFLSGQNGSSGGFSPDIGENVTVAGQNGTYLVTGRSSMVSWGCGDIQYSVLATDLDREALLAAAESLACR
ncbi:LolA family protein [Halobacterium jilantaiense]|uniref:Outer membrane lipoprotein-sorting protein n=1 Tax=Halobacterium jilantaiense TaxID=355548 RepID=A0A1I0MR28_9EURY|nr:outer membrane lipoprotein carrier protein LolA [Halobacterium jilantaiense]SEV91127.1 Outer membrane lipoprotein-sorting protein [Halobacterium jilantaiense]